ncbi:MAG TPA: DUF4040 domain-containing protein [Ignisphaera sp.]|nr:DUF4040 domain-containing protein [Ignisphaera sp.]
MSSSILLSLALLAYLFTIAIVFTYKAIAARDLVKAIIFSAGQSIAFAIAYAILMAPDILYAYLAVGLGIYPILILYAISKTKRFEGDQHD